MSKIKLFCFPNAGSSAMVYMRWKKRLNVNIQLMPVEFAGHGSRMGEAFYSDMNAAIDDIMQNITQHIYDGSKYAFFGHSMGSVVAYELYYRLSYLGYIEPEHIFFSGREAPALTSKFDKHYLLSDCDFKMHLLELGGMTEEVLADKEFSKIILPIVRADYRLLGLHEYRKKENNMKCNISILNGKEDIIVKRNGIDGWRLTTDGETKYYMFNGGHFYINDHWHEIVDIINGEIGY